MKKNIIACLAFITVLVSAYPSFAQAPKPSPVEFYQSLAAGVNKAEGTALLDLVAGNYKTRVNSSLLKWNIEPGTTALIRFNYDGDVLTDRSPDTPGGDPRPAARVEFQHHRVHVWLLGSQDVSGGLKWIEYDSFGHVMNWDIQWDNADPSTHNPSNIPKVQRQLEMFRTPNDMFTGRVIKTMNSATPVNDAGNATANLRSMVSRISFLKESPSDPGLLIGFREGANIYFSKSAEGSVPKYDNWVTLSAPSTLTFSELTYDLDEQSLNGKLENLDFHIRQGHISSGDITARLGSGSSLKFDNVDFSRESNGTATVDARFGTLTASFMKGSNIALALGTDNPSSIVMDDGTTVRLQALKLDIDDKHSTVLSVGNGSEIDMKVFSGKLAVGKNGSVQIQNGEFNIDLQGTWNSETRRPDVSGIVSLLNVNIGMGSIPINETSTLNITSGHIGAATDSTNTLLFNSNQQPALTGKFNNVLFDIGENTLIGVPNGFVLTTGTGGQVTSNDPQYPLQLVKGRPLPIGRYVLKLPFQRFSDSQNSTMSLFDGRLVCPLENNLDGSVTSQFRKKPETAPDGSTAMVLDLASNGEPQVEEQAKITVTGNESAPGARLALVTDEGYLNASVLVTDGVLFRRADLPRFRAMWSGKFSDGILKVHTKAQGFGDPPGIDGHSDARVYPIMMNLTMDSSVDGTFGPTLLMFQNNHVNTKFATKLQFAGKFSPESKLGEYIGNSPDITSTENGSYHNSIEVAKDKNAGVWSHIYLHRRDYTFGAKFNADLSPNAPTVMIDEIQCVPAIVEGDDRGWSRDGGGNLTFLGVLAGLIVGTVAGSIPTGLPPGTTIILGGVGGVAGGVGGHLLEGHIEGLVNAKIMETINTARTWHLKL